MDGSVSMGSPDPVSPLVDHVIGVFPRDALSAALAETHRAGFGPQTRVFDGARADVTQQLDRAGIQIQGEQRPPADALLLVVTAPGRAANVSRLFERLGAASVWFAARRAGRDARTERTEVAAPDIRIGDAAATEGLPG